MKDLIIGFLLLWITFSFWWANRRSSEPMEDNGRFQWKLIVDAIAFAPIAVPAMAIIGCMAAFYVSGKKLDEAKNGKPRDW